MSTYLDSLNNEQKAAVLTTEGPLLIIAGAGTGKTKTLTTRIAHLITTGVPGDAILAVTFTNKAAKEMRERVERMIPSNAKLPTLKTFHSLGLEIIKTFPSQLGLKPGFSILDTDDQLSMVKSMMESAGYSTKEWDPRAVLKTISRLRLLNQNLESLEKGTQIQEIATEIWRKYQKQKRQEGVVDFDDLLELPVKLLEEHPEIRAFYQKKWQYVHIDEYQDTSDLQYQFTQLLTGPAQNICVVGDGDQTIYTWRGATIKNILQFTSNYPNAVVVQLTTNYRSTQTVLDAANAIIAKNSARIAKELKTHNNQGQNIVLYKAFDEMDEARWVASTAEETKKQNPQDTIAVLYRTHFQSRAIEEAFLGRDMPYTITGTKFFARREVKDLLAWVRCSYNRENLTDLKRVCETPKRGIGKVAWAHICSQNTGALSGKARDAWHMVQKKLDEIHEFSKTHSPSESVAYALMHSGIEQELLSNNDPDDMERLANARELVSYAIHFDATDDDKLLALQTMIEHAALISESDSIESHSDAPPVHLLTVHSAKGLEFDTVFIVGLEDGLFPSNMGAEDTTRDPEEERRLMYVALTRARKTLYLSHAFSRRIFGNQLYQKPSEFVSDIPNHIIESHGEAPAPLTTSYLDW